MNRLQAYKFQLRLAGAQIRDLYRIAGSCRFVYNKALTMQKKRYESGEKKLTYAGVCKKLTEWRNDPDLKWLRVPPSQALQQSLKDLERAYQNFFAKRTDFPRFKKRGSRDSFRFPQGVKLDQGNSRIFLPKLGWVRYRKSREVKGDLCQVTISRFCDKWYVSVQTERQVLGVIHPAKTSIGIDMGVARFAVLSDGTIYESINSFKLHQNRLAAYQKKASKKKKFSKNWKKVISKIGRTHHKICHIRGNYLHQISNIICKNHAMISLEDLQVKNMSKSAAGDLVSPGKNVKAKSGLNKSILDQGWGEFRRQVEYKQAWRGGIVITVPPQYSSQTCPECDHVDAMNRPTRSQFVCVKCHYKNDADMVGAINVLRAGHARLACGEMVRLGHSMNQEPTEVAHALVHENSRNPRHL